MKKLLLTVLFGLVVLLSSCGNSFSVKVRYSYYSYNELAMALNNAEFIEVNSKPRYYYVFNLPNTSDYGISYSIVSYIDAKSNEKSTADSPFLYVPRTTLLMSVNSSSVNPMYFSAIYVTREPAEIKPDELIVERENNAVVVKIDTFVIISIDDSYPSAEDFIKTNLENITCVKLGN